ncbi:hypothetical protein K435DRAFT_822268 [Dendrothele bispora CBS 962.96]|uniref:SH3 domain-containing protein n=1 Tax=Dendrothele bispora (strain CBS 962.96) TaxID=1314807 RepID=A0A4S8LAY3_DENBC|nr:hypothetical protein K435DRAFT_822268 [Dendrothele bispora CBS 962.96]
MSVRPFSPSEAWAFPKPPRSSDSSVGGGVRPLSFGNPFEDKKQGGEREVKEGEGEGEEFEIIQRPFVPSMEDELRVSVGEKVKIVQVFTDGWALIERNAVDDVKGKGVEGSAAARGLIPVDCFRQAGQELPTFLREKNEGAGWKVGELKRN